MKTILSLGILIAALTSVLGLVGCDDVPTEPLGAFTSPQAVCTSPGDCHVTRMPSNNDLGYTVRPRG